MVDKTALLMFDGRRAPTADKTFPGYLRMISDYGNSIPAWLCKTNADEYQFHQEVHSTKIMDIDPLFFEISLTPPLHRGSIYTH